MDIKKIEKQYNAMVKNGLPMSLQRLQFELLLEIVKELKEFRESYEYHNQRGI